MRKFMAAALSALTAASMLVPATAFADEETTEAEQIVTEPTTITFIFADGDEGFKQTMNTLVDEFNEANPDITIEIQPGNGGSYSEFLKTKDSVGEFPDLMEQRDTAMYVRAGKLLELPEEITSLVSSTMEFDGKVYAVPMAGENTQGIYYNKKYFDENGLEEPTTYDEFIELCQTIQDLGDMSPLVVGGQDIWHMGFWFNKAYDDQVISQDPDFIAHCYEGTKDFSDETFKATFEELKDIMQYAQEGWTSTPDAQITTFLVNDMSAMLFSGTHMINTIEEADPDFELGWFPVPSPDGKLRLVGGAGIGGWAISAADADDANKVAAAEAFLKFFYEPENYKFYCESMNAIPVAAEMPDLDVDPILQEVVDATQEADSLSPMWNGKSGDNELPPDFRNFVYKTLIEYMQGTKDLDSAISDINATWAVDIESFNPVTGVGVDTAE
ncbi:MAG: ABC transporter substrate-binding protein [Lachnospiraceae bacterium]|jgi:raffinose/stachyose/melibiose transport system substrate-binding protein